MTANTITITGEIQTGGAPASGENFIKVTPMEGSQDQNPFFFNVKHIKKFRLRDEPRPSRAVFWDEKDQLNFQTVETFADDDELIAYVAARGITAS